MLKVELEPINVVLRVKLDNEFVAVNLLPVLDSGVDFLLMGYNRALHILFFRCRT